jgi:hypothetical protein
MGRECSARRASGVAYEAFIPGVVRSPSRECEDSIEM